MYRIQLQKIRKNLLRMHATLNVTIRDINQQKLENRRTEHALNSVINNDNPRQHRTSIERPNLVSI